MKEGVKEMVSKYGFETEAEIAKRKAMEHETFKKAADEQRRGQELAR